MTKKEAEKIPDLQIRITPAVEDAFYFLQGLQENGSFMTESQIECGRNLSDYSETEKFEAIHDATRMLRNIEKYGVACAEWCE